MGRRVLRVRAAGDLAGVGVSPETLSLVSSWAFAAGMVTMLVASLLSVLGWIVATVARHVRRHLEDKQ